MKNKQIKLKQSFTLIELLVAMAVFSVLTLVLMQFFGSAQRLWSKTATQNEVETNAKLAMDLIVRDLQSAYYDSENKNGRYFDITNPELLEFASILSTAPSGSTSRTCEVYYQKDSDFNLRVGYVGDGDGVRWDFYKQTTAPNPFDDALDLTQWHTIIPRVIDFRIEAFQKDQSQWRFTTSSVKLPYAVLIKLTLLDKTNFAIWKEKGHPNSGAIFDKYVKQNRKTFTKLVILDRGQYDN